MKRSNKDARQLRRSAVPIPAGGLRLQVARFPLMLVALLVMLLAGWAGLVRIGWRLPPLQPALPMAHGPLMVVGFLGTLISLERAVALAALGRRWAYAAPALSALGALWLLIGLPGPVGPLLLAAASLGALTIFVHLLRHQPAWFTAMMALGALALLVGNVLWLAGQPVYSVVWWWAAYLLLTIVGERLELSRLVRVPKAAYVALAAVVGLLCAGVLLVSAGVGGAGTRVIGAAFLGQAAWLLRFDLARRTVRREGLTRFIAASLLAGYVWLAVSGVLALLFGRVVAGPRYDAVLHTFFLGFVFGIIFGHAPIIFPAVLRIRIEYSPAFYVHVALLHASLLLRVAGDLAGLPTVRQWGGLINYVALLWFVVNTARMARKDAMGVPIGAEQDGRR